MNFFKSPWRLAILSAMTELQRITIDYVDVEDRLRLRGQNAEGETRVFWMTQRLLMRLIPHLCSWLEKQTIAGAPVEIVQGFAQQAAWAALQAGEPVPLPAQQEGTLIRSVDLTPADKRLILRFKADPPGEAIASVAFEAQPLRQWLGIVHRCCEAAGWPDQAWPHWVVEARSPGPNSQTAVMH
jgi:hypothetical protein